MEQAELPVGGAEAVLNFQPNTTLTVAYHSLFGSHDDLLLLELDEKFVPEVLHQRVELRGQPDEDAVLCTQTKTFAIKFVGTSNSAFLIPPSGQFATSEKLKDSEREVNDQQNVIPVIKVAPGSMELTEVAPRLDRLRLLLSENPYTSDETSEMEDSENAGSIGKRLYKWVDLVDMVQASDSEIKMGLEALSAVEIDGYWRIVDDKYMDTILRMLLHNAVLNDWSLSALSEEEVVSVLVSDGFPRELGLHCLQVYGSKEDRGEGDYVWKLDERRVCVQFAREILRGGKKKMDNFMVDWLRIIPDGMHANLEMLEGEVLTEKLGVETWICAFSISSLPSSPAERFSLLFRERSKWEWKDLQPFIRDLNVPGLSSEALLLKYTRRSQPTSDAEPIFTARGKCLVTLLHAVFVENNYILLSTSRQ